VPCGHVQAERGREQHESGDAESYREQADGGGRVEEQPAREDVRRVVLHDADLFGESDAAVSRDGLDRRVDEALAGDGGVHGRLVGRGERRVLVHFDDVPHRVHASPGEKEFVVERADSRDERRQQHEHREEENRDRTPDAREGRGATTTGEVHVPTEAEPADKSAGRVNAFRAGDRTPRMDRDSIQTVSVLVYDGFDELDAIAPYEVFANAGLDARIVSPHGASVVEASHGLRVETDTDHDRPDLLLAPGGGWNDRDQPGAWTEYEDGTIPQYLADAHENGATVAGVCTGGMLLAEAGLLQDRPATTHHTATDDLQATGARIADARVVDCGDVLTAGGVTSGLDLAFQLIETIRGRDTADEVKTEMEYEPRGKTLVAR